MVSPVDHGCEVPPKIRLALSALRVNRVIASCERAKNKPAERPDAVLARHKV
jgi:hypothetical protein